MWRYCWVNFHQSLGEIQNNSHWKFKRLYTASSKIQNSNHIRDLIFDAGHLEILENIPHLSHTDKQIVYHEFNPGIFREIKKLPPGIQEILILNWREHYTNFEIAKKINISVQTVEKNISDALNLLKMKINPHQFTVFIMGMLLQC